MSTLVLHIGSPKAGSSAIQASLEAAQWSPRWRQLPANPYGKSTPSGFIAAFYLQSRSLPRFLARRRRKDPEAFDRDLRHYRKLLRQQLKPLWPRSRPEGAVLSCEYLWRLSVESIGRLRQDFEDLGVRKFVVVAYVREPVSAYASFLQQWARLATTFDTFNPEIWRYRFRDRLTAWSEVFGDSLIVRPFDKLQLRDGCVTSDFQALVRGRPGECFHEFPELRSNSTVNHSASMEELVAMNELMRRFPVPLGTVGVARSKALVDLWNQLQMQVHGQPATAIKVRESVVEWIRRNHQDDLTWLEKYYDVRFAASRLGLVGGNNLTGSEAFEADITENPLCAFFEPPSNLELLARLREILSLVRLPMDT